MASDLEIDPGDVIAIKEGLDWHNFGPIVLFLLGFILAWLILMTPSVTGYVTFGFTILLVVSFTMVTKSKKVTLHGYKNAFVIREAKSQKIIRFHNIESAELISNGMWRGTVVLKGLGQREALDFKDKSAEILAALKQGRPDLTAIPTPARLFQRSLGIFLIAFVGGILGLLIFAYSQQILGEWFLLIVTVFNVFFIFRSKRTQSNNRLVEVLP